MFGTRNRATGPDFLAALTSLRLPSLKAVLYFQPTRNFKHERLTEREGHRHFLFLALTHTMSSCTYGPINDSANRFHSRVGTPGAYNSSKIDKMFSIRVMVMCRIASGLIVRVHSAY